MFRRVVSGLLLGAMALVLTGCDEVVEFTLVNDTDEDVITWVLLADCDERGRRDDYLPERTVPAHGRITYEDVFGSGGPPEGRCVQASTLERRLILSEPYRNDAVYTIQEPLQEGALAPETEALPAAPYPVEYLNETYEGLHERPVGTIIWILFVIVFLLVVPLGLFAALVFLSCWIIWVLLKWLVRAVRY